MENQYWGSIHVLPDQTQTGEIDGDMREFLSGLHFKSPKTFYDHVGRWYNGLTSSYSMMFMNVGYVDKYTNLPKTKDYHASIYGVSGIHNIARQSRYVHYYMSDEETLLGADFFQYVFGSFYISEEEARNTSEKVKALLDRKKAIRKKNNYYTEISEDDRELVCRIVERLWSCQLDNVGTRLVLCFEQKEIQSRSLALLKQMYLLIPQRLRMNMGFCTNSNMEDIRYLTETCELPVHVFTMSVNNMDETRKAFEEAGLKYPVVCFDVNKPENEPCNVERLELIRSLSQKLSPSSDAKIAYAEKVVLKEERGAQVSFKNLQKTFEKINEKNFCWWERGDLEQIEDIYQLYHEQNEMMKVEILHEESVNTFYRKLLPWKAYADQIAEAVRDEHYPNRKEILEFFATELQFAKVIEAMENLKEKMQLAAEKDERAAVAEVQQSWSQDVAQKKQQYEKMLEEKQSAYLSLDIERKREVQEYENRLKEQKRTFERQLDAQALENRRELEREKQKNREEIEKLKEVHAANFAAKTREGEQEIGKLKDTIRKMEESDSDQARRKLQAKLLGENKEKHAAQKKAKTFLITTIAAAGVAAVLLGTTIFFGVQSTKSGELLEDKQQLETEKKALESEKKVWQSEKKDLDGKLLTLEEEKNKWQSKESEMEKMIETLESERDALQSETPISYNETQETEIRQDIVTGE